MPDDDSIPAKLAGPPISDVLGVQKFGEAGLELTKATVGLASDFLRRICMPVADELGDWAREEVHHMRKRRQNTVKIAERARRMVEARTKEEVHAPPKLVAGIIELGSWEDDEELQQMWAGLLASACTPDGRDDSNLIFKDILSRLTGPQARFISGLCSGLRSSPRNLPRILTGAGSVIYDAPDLQKMMGLSTVDEVICSIEAMRNMGLFRRFDMPYEKFPLQLHTNVTRLALQLFVRCHGFRGTIEEFYVPQPSEAVKV